ncbi:UDP-glucose 4-epimerase GalE [Actinocrinis puniceicyclus]|uniref:UDP-glucose 4-epimerase n=1 Tax=Actinocrinis puniceicyclus TaxID=977794 RepID=A0A8J7WHW8_9ACTN|nr:UDP-glucose 4-epimerase GalE [Actinocrinis puniceicyclus]MBS2962566.1 UDP-glucose 4-epimerase GalE [Actinocrinis puniceicyclus]
MTWLVTGGAGYIGSHVVRALLADGARVAVLDDLSSGDKRRVPDGVPLEVASVLDRDALGRVFAEHRIGGVVHIAAKKQVGESVEKPLWYYEQNVGGLRVLLEAMVAAGVRRLVFSSSAAVYGSPDVPLITEDTPCEPQSPYGETKLVGEWLIRDTAHAHGLSYANLRYFNVAGAASPELSDPTALNVVPMVFERIDAGLPPRIFGDDYDTPDGTAIRDYVHVSDIAGAHVAAARRLGHDEHAALTLNIGRGEGVSVRALVDRILQHAGSDLVPEVTPRRPGDGARSIASADRIKAELGWSARYDIADMVASAWAGWRMRHDAFTH